MKETDSLEENKININEQEEKLNLLKKKNYLLSQELMNKKEEMHKLNEESKNLYDQITYYNKQIQKESNNNNNNNDTKNKSTIIDSSFNSMNPLMSNSNINENFIKIENEDEFLVYETLKNKLDEINLNMDIVEHFPERKNDYENSNLSYDCICVCLLEIFDINENENKIVDKTFNIKNKNNNNKENIKKIYYQTFIINKKTRIFDVLKESLIFWDKFNKENDYNIGLIIENSIKKINVNENELLINIFKNMKNNLKSIKFLLYPKNEKISFDEIFEDENNNNNSNNNTNLNNNNNNNSNDNNNNFIKFLKCIAGTRKFIEEKYNKIKEEKNKEKEILSDENKINLKFIITKSLFLILYFLFFLFSILNLCDMKNSKKTFEQRETILNGINYFNNFNNKIYFNSDKNLINEILISFKYILFHIENDSPTFKLVNNVRFSFYENNKIECNKILKDYYFNYFDNKIIECSDDFYKKTNENKNFDIDYILNYKEKFCDENNETSEFYVKKFFVYEICDVTNNKTEILNKCNYIKNCSDFYYYLSEIIKHNTYNNIKKINIQGDYGIYKGENSYDINIPLNYINNNTLNAILNSLIKEDLNSNNYFSFFNQKITKSILIDFTLYDYNSNNYFYVYILYELGENFGKKLTKKDVIPFYPNLKKIYYGKRIKILDIFRLIIIIFLFLIFLNNFIDNFSNKNKTKTFKKKKKIIQNESKFYNIFSLHNFLDLLSFIFYLIIFIKKKHFLYQNQEKNENLTIIKNFIIPKNFEYFSIANQYEIIIILESLLILILIIRIICFFKLKRIKFFQFYLKKSLIRIFPFFLIYIFLILAFSIFANKLFGLHNNNFSDFKNSFFKIIQFSILHFDFDDFKFNGRFINYEALFMLLFYMIIIFYITSNFLGILIEDYRLNSLKYGNIYSNRMSKKIKKNEKNKIESESEKNEKKNIN